MSYQYLSISQAVVVAEKVKLSKQYTSKTKFTIVHRSYVYNGLLLISELMFKMFVLQFSDQILFPFMDLVKFAIIDPFLFLQF